MKREKPLYPRNIIGARIRELRNAASPKISQEDLCGRLAKYDVTLTRTQITKIENGRRPVFDYEAIAFAKILRTSLDILFGRD